MSRVTLVTAARRTSRAFTLLELLVVLCIIGILASILLGALYASQEKARADQTRKTITKLDALIRAQWDTYRTRRLALNRGGMNTRAFAALQLRTRWALQRAEMPDRYSDITTNGTAPTLLGLPGENALQNAYISAINFYREQYNAQNAASDDEAAYLARIRATNQSAECLFLTITVGLNGLDEVQFTEAEIGDTDEDGMPEFLDGYGQPINFLRWAPGFESELQARNPDTSPDPLDPLGVGRELSSQAAIVKPSGGGAGDYGFKLYPLIYSPGPDGEGAIMLLGESVDDNPYEFFDFNGTPYQRGAAMPASEAPEGGRFDNIYNHYLGGR
jgi:prepilin-type N-terminal cleavage/methylation domain-containing protein